MATKMKIKKGDQVMITAGNDKGKTGEVLEVLGKKEAVSSRDAKLQRKPSSPAMRIRRADLHKKRCLSISPMLKK